MKKDIKSKEWISTAYPIVGIIFSILAFFTQEYSIWVTATAAIIGIVFVLAWLLSQAGWIGKAIKLRWFRAKLSKDHALRLSILLDDVDNMLSYSCTLSPFNVWHNCSNEYSTLIRMNYRYYGSIGTWLNDLKIKFYSPYINNTLLLDSLSKVISELTNLAEFAEADLEKLIKDEQLTEQGKNKIIKNWDSARSHFNEWVDRWRVLFKELNKTRKTNCVEHFRSLKMIG